MAAYNKAVRFAALTAPFAMTAFIGKSFQIEGLNSPKKSLALQVGLMCQLVCPRKSRKHKNYQKYT